MDSVKYIGMDVHKEAISLAVLNSSGKKGRECSGFVLLVHLLSVA
jgi:hypothetical protein